MSKNSPSIIFFGAIITIMFSCKKACPDFVYECMYAEKPDSALINLKLTINDENQWVGIDIFKGNFENSNSNRVFSGIAFNEDFFTLLPIGRYTARATYLKNNDTIWSINSGKSNLIRYDCDFPCFDVKEATIDLKLKK
jgi:hypothetical protein